jgi:hypothetical protein
VTVGKKVRFHLMTMTRLDDVRTILAVRP